MLIAFLLFFAAGLVFGAVIPSGWAWSALALPLLLALASAASNGVDAHLLLVLALALVVTGLGVLAGRVLAARLDEERRPAGRQARRGLG